MREILSALIIYYSKIELLLGRGLEKDGGVGRTEAGRPLGLSQRTWSDWVRHRRASAVNCFVAEASLSTSATLKVLIADDSSSIRRACPLWLTEIQIGSCAVRLSMVKRQSER
jgi:hypothetical protein